MISCARQIIGRSLACAALLFASACSSSHTPIVVAPDTRVAALKFDAQNPAFWNGVEQFRAKMSFLGISAGELEVQITPRCDQQGTMKHAEILSKMSTTGVVRWMVRRDGHTSTHVDPITALPTRQLMEVHDGGPVRNYDLKLSPGRLEYVYVKGEEPEKRGEILVPGEEHPLDVQSAVVLLRAWRPRVGDVARFYVAVGRGIWHAHVAYKGIVPLEIDGTTHRAVLVVGEARKVPTPNKPSGEPRHFKIWFSENASRIPLRIAAEADYGDAEFVLEVHNSQPGCAPLAATPNP